MRRLIIYLLTLFFSIFFSNLVFANYCADLENYLKNTTDLLQIEKYPEYGFGFELKKDLSLLNIESASQTYDLPYDRDKNGYLIIGSIDKDSPFNKFYQSSDNGLIFLTPYDKIVSVNGISVSDLDDETFSELINSFDEIDFKFQLYEDDNLTILSNPQLINGLLEIKIKKDDFMKSDFFFTQISPMDLIEIDSQKGEYIFEYRHDVSFYINLNENMPVPKKDELSSCSFQVSSDEDLFAKYNIKAPMILFPTLIETISTKQNYIDFFYIDDYLAVHRVKRNVSKFSDVFNYKLFPFDKPKIVIPFYPFDTNDYVSSYFGIIKNLAYENYFFQENIITPGFKILNTDYYSHVDDFYSESYMHKNEYYFEINLARSSFYYLTKVILPIFLVLLLSWSSFWIRSKDIESKLTVTIICFLSLIAYNFVVDDSIPKLDYLTWLDYFIFSSYVLCSLSTFCAVYDYRNQNVQSDKFSKLTDLVRSSGIPVYILFNLIIYFSIIIFFDYG